MFVCVCVSDVKETAPTAAAAAAVATHPGKKTENEEDTENWLVFGFVLKNKSSSCFGKQDKIKVFFHWHNSNN